MSLAGNLADIAIVDLLQFVHLSARSGTLHLERDIERAHISLHRGKIVTAWAPASPSVCDLLREAGAITAEGLARAREQQAAEASPVPLGRLLVTVGGVTREALRDAIRRKVEQTIFELIGWTRGAFRFVVDEVRSDSEVALAPGDIIPEADINTQMVLMEALRLFDERNHHGGNGGVPEPARVSADTSAVIALPPEVRGPPGTVQLVTRDEALATRVIELLRGRIDARRVPLIDAGIPAPGQMPPVVVLDARPGQLPADAVKRHAAQHPRAPMIAIVAPGTDPVAVIAAGAVSALPPDAASVASCCAALVAARGGTAPDDDLRAGLARLRRVLGDLRSGLLSATVSLNLMTIVADSVERAVLFVARGGTFVAIGAFGAQEGGRPLAETSQGIVLRPAKDSPLAICVADGHARVVEFAEPHLPAELIAVVDRPLSGQAVLFPVLGVEKVIALVYADNGRRLRPIGDVEIVEIATSQVGLAFENELLRRQLAR